MIRYHFTCHRSVLSEEKVNICEHVDDNSASENFEMKKKKKKKKRDQAQSRLNEKGWIVQIINVIFILLVAGCDIGVRFSVRPSVRPSVRLSTFMSTFDIYVKVSILINYKTKQPSNLA